MTRSKNPKKLILPSQTIRDNGGKNSNFICTYHPDAINFTQSKIVNIFKLINDKYFNNTLNFISAKKQPANLLNSLRFPNYFQTRTCNLPRCKTCKIIKCEKKQTFLHNRIIIFNSNMKCNSSNVIYALLCSKCDLFYIGKTSTPLNIRVNLHRNQIDNIQYCNLNVSKHIRICGKREFSILPIYKLPNGTSTYLRRNMENYFINYLKPQLNA